MSTLTPTLSVRPPDFTAGQAAQSVLCLELATQRLRVSLLDPQRQLVWLDEYTEPSALTEQPLLTQLPALFTGHPLLHFDTFDHVRVSVVDTAFTLIPAPLYRKEYATNYLTLMRGHEPPPTELTHAYEHKEGFVSVFGVDRAVTEFLGEQYPMQPFTYAHQHTALIEATRAVDQTLTSTENLFLYFDDASVTVLFRQQHALRYCNRFGFRNVQDLTYYVLYVLDELEADPEAVQPFVYGESTPFAESYTALSRFLHSLQIGPFSPGLTATPALDELPEHRYLSLQGLALV